MQIPIEIIPSEDHVFRNVTIIQFKQWKNDQPNPSDFMLREGETGLSVNWDKYCTIDEVVYGIGMSLTKKRTQYQDPRTYKIIKFGVADIRLIKLMEDGESLDVIHCPDDNRPKPLDIAHSEIRLVVDDEVRLKLSELVKSYDPPVVEIDLNPILQKLEIDRPEIILDEN